MDSIAPAAGTPKARPQPKVYSIRETCRLLRKGFPAVKALIAGGDLPTVDIAGSTFVPAFAVDRLIGNVGPTPDDPAGWIAWQADVMEQMAAHFQAIADGYRTAARMVRGGPTALAEGDAA